MKTKTHWSWRVESPFSQVEGDSNLPFPKRKNHKKEEMVVVTMKKRGK
jgi:hypothetical protein